MNGFSWPPDLPVGPTVPAPVDVFLGRITDRLPQGCPVTSLLVAHMLPGQEAFIGALKRISTVAAALPKPKSIDDEVLARVRQLTQCDSLSRRRFADERPLLEYLEARAAGKSLVLLDVGGYFAPALAEVCSAFSGRIVGVIEDTENGLRRYLRYQKLPCPIYSVARSPLKEAEDTLVGEGVVFSAEALIRGRGEVLPGRAACVIGYGKVGAAIARTLRARHVQVTVVDTDPVRLTQALALGYQGSRRLPDALATASLVFCATGNRSLRAGDCTHLCDGAYVATVTSHDDELDLVAADASYLRTPVTPHITRYSTAGQYFYLLNDGNAVNFLHGSAVGPSIHLVQAEILAAVGQLALEPHDPGLYEVAPPTRELIATAWVNTFYPPE